MYVQRRTTASRYPLSTLLQVNGSYIDLEDAAISSIEFSLEYVAPNGEVVFKIPRTSTNVTPQPTNTYTVDETNDRILCAGSGLEDNYEVTFQSDGTVPGGLTEDRRYFLVNADANSFQVSDNPGGTAIALTNFTGSSNTFKLIGNAQYAWAANDLRNKGKFTGRWWITYTDGSTEIFLIDNQKESIEIGD